MYIAAYIFRRVPGMSLEDFLDYYKNQHGPCMVALMKDKGLISYDHYPIRETNLGDIYVPEEGPAYDAIPIYAFESAEAAKVCWEMEEVKVDSQNFIDFDSMQMLPLTHRTVFPK